MADSEVPVLVVGGGPVGLMAGLLLAQHGVEARVVERNDGPRRVPAAHVVNARTFEICRAAGVDMEAIARVCMSPADGGESRFWARLGEDELGWLPFERQDDACLDLTPTPLRNLAQNRFEPILLDALRRAGGRIDFGTRLDRCEADATGVTATLEDLATGRVDEVRSRWLIAADGAGSRVRRSLGIELTGPARLQRFLMIYFGANLRPVLGDRLGALHWVFSPEVTGTFVGHDVEGEWVYMHAFPDDDAPIPSEAACAEIVKRAIGRDDVPVEVLDRSTWVMTAQVAERMRAGRIFLAGDAAHRFPPTGGLGLNSGVADAHNLVWKIAAVESGRSPAALLDTYEQERKPVAQENAEQSLRNALRIVEVPKALGLERFADGEALRAALEEPGFRSEVEEAVSQQAEHFDMLGLQLGYVYEGGALVPDPKATALAHDRVREYVPTSRPGARVPHAWVRVAGERVSLLDLLDPAGFTLVTAADGVAWADAAPRALKTLVPGRDFVDDEGHWERVREIAADGAVLVRPDQHVAWRAHGMSPDPAAALRDALGAVRFAPEAS